VGYELVPFSIESQVVMMQS